MEEGLGRTVLVVHPLLCSRKEKHTQLTGTLYLFLLQDVIHYFVGFSNAI